MEDIAVPAAGARGDTPSGEALKRIAIESLTVGMYVHKVCGSWLDHPFWRKSFLVADDSVLSDVVVSGLREVIIDTGRGLDVAGTAAVEEIAPEPAREPDKPPVDAPAIVTGQTSLQEEMRVAAKVCASAKTAVMSMFNEARMGRALDAEKAMPLVEEIASSVLRNPGALISMARLKQKDDYTYMHSVAVCALMVSLANQLGLGERETREAGLGGLLHDLGKSAIPLDVLNKPAA